MSDLSHDPSAEDDRRLRTEAGPFTDDFLFFDALEHTELSS